MIRRYDNSFVFYGIKDAILNGKEYTVARDVLVGVWYLKDKKTGLYSDMYVSFDKLMSALTSGKIKWVSETEFFDKLLNKEYIRSSAV